ncbi:hypothetical protein [Enterococcus phage vB_Efs8_KEN04]|uniref:Uncharacterized protein n=1 Tax=Enterococcus phage vB_Efs6_KEN16 TaxID=3138325 RepID=A0AAX4PTC2_9CAUD
MYSTQLYCRCPLDSYSLFDSRCMFCISTASLMITS